MSRDKPGRRPPGGQQNTWYMESPAGMLRKLKWEVEQLEGYTDATLEAGYVAMNGATTAWQVFDWIWACCSTEQIAALSGLLGAKSLTKADISRAIQSRYPRIAMCRQTATAVKHGHVDLSYDATHSTGIATKTFTSPPGQVQTDLIFVRGLEMVSAASVLRDALDNWRELLGRAGVDLSLAR